MLEIILCKDNPSGVKEIRWHGKRIDVHAMKIHFSPDNYATIDLLLPYLGDTIIEGEFEATVQIRKELPLLGEEDA